MSVRPYKFGEGIDSFIVLALYCYFACALACVLRLLSHVFHSVSANELRAIYFADCLFFLPLAVRYRVKTSLAIVILCGLLFNPIAPVHIGSWPIWQLLNFAGLLGIGLSGLLIQAKRKDLIAISSAEQKILLAQYLSKQN